MGQVIYDKCEKKYDDECYNKCPLCKSIMKRPSWEKDKRWITKNLFVSSTLKYSSERELLPGITNFI